MARFLETFNVVDGDGEWTSGPQPFDTLASGFVIDSYDVCNPETPELPPSAPLGLDASPFAIKAYQEVPTRCAPENVRDFVGAAMAGSTEYEVTKALWFGSKGTTAQVFLKDSGVEEVARTGDYYSLLGSVLETAYERNPFIQPVIHLGFTSAMALQLGLSNLGLPFVVAPAYPKDAVAVTGPVTVNLGSIEISDDVDYRVNRKQIEATRLAKIRFDPYMAVRAADSV